MLSLAKLQGGTGASYCLAQAQSRVTHAESVSSRVEDYHLADPEAVGQWTGGGLAALELGGEVAEEALMRLLDRQDPRTGEPLPRPPGRPPEVDGFDLIFSVPKSASVLFALGDTPKAPSCVVNAPRLPRTREDAGLPPLGRVTPHTLRYTFISLLLANSAELPYVMAQVGLADESTTLRIDAKALRRDRRHVGEAVDEMVGGATRVPTDEPI